MAETHAEWHREVISPAAEQTVRDLACESALAGFYLAGGTGLALRLGHRRSRDLDLFSAQLFGEDNLLQQLQQASSLTVVARAPGTLHTVIQGVKVSFLAYRYPLLFPLQEFLGIQVADPRDIACMKLSAIASRGAKRDFVDLFATAKQFGLRELLDLFRQKYARSPLNPIHLRKSLVYFDDAESDPMPDMLTPLSWEEAKRFFVAEVQRLL